MDTAFELSCSGWVDDATDLPLLYSFFYKIMDDVTEFQIVSRTPSTRFAGVLLPAGGGNASEVIAIAYPEDQLGAKGYAEAVVVVENPTISVTQLANMTARMLAASFESGDAAWFLQSPLLRAVPLRAWPASKLPFFGKQAPCGASRRRV